MWLKEKIIHMGVYCMDHEPQYHLFREVVGSMQDKTGIGYGGAGMKGIMICLNQKQMLRASPEDKLESYYYLRVSSGV